MKPLEMFIENYKTATSGLSIWGKIIIALVLAFIFIAILFAAVGLIMRI